jgi:O-antigen/teichoic acid export membrane protein
MTTLTNVLVSFLTVVTGFLIARLLVPEARGIFTSITIWPPIFAALCSLGIHEASNYFVGIYPDSSKKTKIIGASFWVGICLSAIGILVFYPILRFLVTDRLGDQYVNAQLYLLFIPIFILGSTLLNSDLGLQNYTRYNLMRLLQTISYTAAVIFLYFNHQSDLSVLTLVTLLTAAVPIMFLVPCHFRSIFQRTTIQDVKLVLQKGYSFMGGVFLSILAVSIDRLLSVSFYDFADVGLFQVAVSLVFGAMSLIGLTYQILVFPLATQISDKSERVVYVANQVQSASLILFAAAIFLSVLAKPLVTLLFGEPYAGAAIIVVYLSWGYALMSVKTIASRSIRSFSEGKIGFIAEAVYVVGLLVSFFWTYSLGWRTNSALCFSVFVGGITSVVYFWISLRIKYELNLKEVFHPVNSIKFMYAFLTQK